MITIISLLIMLLFIKFMFKVLPALIGFSFTLFLTVLQIIGFLFLVPLIGIAFIFLDILVIGAIVVIIKGIIL